MKTAKEMILEYLSYDQYTWGGKMARELCQRTGHKESVIERRARELVNAGLVETDYRQVDGKGPNCVMYRRKMIMPEGKLFNL